MSRQMQYSKLSFRVLFPVALVCFLISGARAIDVPDYDFDWVTIGDPGNPAYDGPWHIFGSYFRPVGKVDRVFRVTRTEVTVSQWFEFVQAYAPFYTGNPLYYTLTSVWIHPDEPNPDGTWTFRMSQGAENFPTSGGIRFIARFCNWLHNGKVNEAWAFEDGAYDASVIDAIIAGDESIEGFARRPDAKFWITSFDEWVKAMFWDPNKYGQNQGGYWKYPHSKDVPPIPGVETNAGRWIGYPEQYDFYDVGGYPDSHSPWGLLDGSGGEDEWMDYEWNPWFGTNRVMVARGSIAFWNRLELHDWIGQAPVVRLMNTDKGFRLASVVPCVADFAVPFGQLDLADIVAFITSFVDGDPAADLAAPAGVFDLADVAAFAGAFDQGCGE